MKTKKKKVSKVLLSLLLAAIMTVEPAAGSIVAYAAEQETSFVENDSDLVEEGEDTSEAIEEEQGNVNEEESENGQDVSDEDSSDESGDVRDEAEKNDADESGDAQGETEDEDSEGNASDENEEEIVSEEEDVEAEDSEGQDAESNSLFSTSFDYVLTSEQKELKSSLAASLSSFDESKEGELYAEREVLVFADSREEAQAFAEAYHAELVGYDLGIAKLKLSNGISVGKALYAAASLDNNLPPVFPNYYRYAHTIEVQDVSDIEEESIESYQMDAMAYNDPFLQTSSGNYQWQHVNVGSTYAWDENYKGSGIKVAVLDTGFTTPDNTELNVAGSWNALTSPVSTSNTGDDVGHGTHVAGIIGARLNGKLGAGIAPEAEIYNIKVLGADEGEDYTVTRGIQKAIDLNVDLINMSLGGIGYNTMYEPLLEEAYTKGIAVFASAGNDGGSTMSYPAAYDHVICVAAVDNNNQRASFSNYGPWVDLSAPGVGIWSITSKTAKDETGKVLYPAGYTSMDGTSQACPTAVGEAAVILSANPSALNGKTGKARVDALESFMKSNTVSAGSGMGKGVTSLTKALKLSVASAKPTAPTIDAKVTEDGQSVNVTISAAIGTTIYYTTNGKAPTYKNGVLGDADNTVKANNKQTFSLSAAALAKQSITIQAIAVNASGVSSAVKKTTCKLNPYVTNIEISGVSRIVAGKSSQLTATVSPSYAANKKVDWKVTDSAGNPVADDAVKISTSGKVTAAKTAATGTYIVTATSQDNNKKSANYTITVINEAVIKSVSFSEKTHILTIPKDSSYNMGSILTAEAVKDDITVSVADFVWSSSNKEIATVSDKGVVTPLKAGSVTITALANDTSGKKATCKFTIKQLATGISISGDDQLAAGKKITLKATVLPATASNKKVEWSITKGSGEAVEASDGVAVSTSGVVSAKANAKGTYKVTAKAMDGSENVVATKEVVIKDGVITSVTFDKKKDTIFRVQTTSATPIRTTINATLKGNGNFATTAYTCTSSNTGIATAQVTSDDKAGNLTITVTATGRAVGKTNITLAATDGSGKKVTCAVTVNNPVSKVLIAPAAGCNQYVVPGKSLALKATLESEYGALSNKKVDWAIIKGAINGVTVNSSGKVSVSKAVKTEGTVTIQATAKDGSGASATYDVEVIEGIQGFAAIIYLVGADGQPKPTEMDSKAVYGLYKGGSASFIIGFSGYPGAYPAVSSSNPKVMSATVDYAGYSDGVHMFYVDVAGDKAGSSKITIKAMDGSGKSWKYNFAVR